MTKENVKNHCRQSEQVPQREIMVEKWVGVGGKKKEEVQERE